MGSSVRHRVSLTTIGLVTFLLPVLTVQAIPPGYQRDIEEQARSGQGSASTSQSELLSGGSNSPVLSNDGDVIFCSTDNFDLSSFGGSDCWGWEGPDGTEYAIMGTAEGVAFVNVTAGQLVQVVPGPTSGCGNIRWRDMVTYGHYCYVVSECTGNNQGMMIINMQNLPSSVSLVGTYSIGFLTSHNMSIDTVRGFAYVLRSSYDGFVVINLSNPESPSFVRTVFVPNIHDLFARNDTVWVAEANNGTFSVWNLANKNNPQLIVRINIPNSGYVHNIWPSDAASILATTEETPNKTVKLWDVQDYGNVQLVGEYLGSSNLAHNAHIENGTCFLSHYESGVVVVDISDPSNPVQISQFDTWPDSDDPTFNGCWGVFPHTNSGKIYASNDYGRLYVLDTVTVQIADTLTIDSVVVFPGDFKVSVDVSIDNILDVRRFVIPFGWAGPYNLDFDSVTTTGLRTSYFRDPIVAVVDKLNSRAVVVLISSSTGEAPDLPPGTGPIATLHFTIDGILVDTPNPITLQTVNGTVPEVTTECFAYVPGAVSGFVALWTPPPPLLQWNAG